MRRKPKKLTLSRETLSILDESRLVNVEGGATLKLCTGATVCNTGCCSQTNGAALCC
jgi:hypothetical protein